MVEATITGKNSGRTFTIEKEIGNGGFGYVHEVTEIPTAEKGALKRPRLGEDTENILPKEAELQGRVLHDHITPVVLFDTATGSDLFWLLLLLRLR